MRPEYNHHGELNSWAAPNPGRTYNLRIFAPILAVRNKELSQLPKQKYSWPVGVESLRMSYTMALCDTLGPFLP